MKPLNGELLELIYAHIKKQCEASDNNIYVDTYRNIVTQLGRDNISPDKIWRYCDILKTMDKINIISSKGNQMPTIFSLKNISLTQEQMSELIDPNYTTKSGQKRTRLENQVFEHIKQQCEKSLSRAYVDTYINMSMILFNTTKKYNDIWKSCNRLKDKSKIYTVTSKKHSTIFSLEDLHLTQEQIDILLQEYKGHQLTRLFVNSNV